MNDLVKTYLVAAVVIVACLCLPLIINPEIIGAFNKWFSLMAAIASALYWYRASIAPIPDFPVGHDLLPTSAVVVSFKNAMKKSADLNRVAAFLTAVAASGASYAWYLNNFWHVAG